MLNRGVNLEFKYDPQFNLNFLTEESMKEKNSLFRDCTRLGVLLIFYYVVSYALAYVFYYVTYFVLEGSFTLNYRKIVKTLLEDHESLISSTEYGMSANLAVTAVSLLLTLLLCRLAFKIRPGGFVRPDKEGAKTAAIWIPACFVINMIFSLATAYLTAFLGAQGVYVPSADFSISSPSAAAIIMQLVYVVLLAPFIEEFIYRGLILGILSKYGRTSAIILSALAFGLMHGNIPQAASAFGTGLVYAIIAVNCGSIMPTVIIHMVNNLIANSTDLADVLDIPNFDLYFSIFEIAVALAGFYVLFTRSGFLKYKENSCQLDKKTVSRTVFTNPAIVIYLAMLVYEIIRKIVAVN